MADPIRVAETHDRVVRTIASYVGVAESEVTDEKKLSDIDPNHSSLDDVELVMDFEDEFGIEIDDEDAEALSKKNVGEIVAWFEQHPTAVPHEKVRGAA